jgi:hypothetical protein
MPYIHFQEFEHVQNDILSCDKNIFYTNLLFYLVGWFFLMYTMRASYGLKIVTAPSHLSCGVYSLYIYFTFICMCMNKKYCIYASSEYQYMYHLSSWNIPKILSTIITVRVHVILSYFI